MKIPNVPIKVVSKNNNPFLPHKESFVKRRSTNNKHYDYYCITKCTRCNKECLQDAYNHKVSNPFCSFDCKFMYELKQYDPTSYKMMELINDPDFYYLIGLICTDGFIKYKDGYGQHLGSRCEIQLKKLDKDLLLRIQQKFGGTVSEKYNKYVIYNRDFIHYLRDDVKILRNKTYNLNIEEWFNNLNESFKKSFLHGVIDGDGCVFYKKYKKSTTRLVYVTTVSEDFADMLNRYFSRYCSNVYIREGFDKKKSTVPYFNVQINGHEVKKLKDIFEASIDICLKRKIIIFNNICNDTFS